MSDHFALGEYVKRAHTPPERIIGIFTDEFTMRLTLLAQDGSVSHVVPVALNH